MVKYIFMLLLIAHVLGDYYFQSQKLAQEKERSFKKVCYHSIVYGAACFAVVLTVADKWLLLAAAIAAASHFLIDLGKWMYIQKALGRTMTRVYIADQSAHILCLLAASILTVRHMYSFEVQSTLKSLLQILEIEPIPLISWLVTLLLLWKPANVAIKKLLYAYKPAENSLSDQDDKRAGAFIGSLERLIMLLLLAVGQYAAIGLVLTAKSIARYDRISKDQEFAEYYLLGTLLSTAMVIICYFIFMDRIPGI